MSTPMIAPVTPPPDALRPPPTHRRLLLVDDEPNILAALNRLLRRDGYEVFCADSGAAGLEVLSKHGVDVIVSDQRMPGMLGVDFLRRARAICPDSIRIMLSGYTELQSVTDAVNEGAIFKFLTKPWDDAQLRGHIAEGFRIKEIADDNERLHREIRSANQKLEQLLLEKQEQIRLDETALEVARDLMEHLPLALVGVDDGGMIAFVNACARRLFGARVAVLGDAEDVHLASPASEARDLHNKLYDITRYPMGARSASRGTLLTFVPRQTHDQR
jgi:CheY-like chemotaxis protein